MKIRLSKCCEDIAAIHDALYSYNLSKTGSERLDVHAERFPEQFALLLCDENDTVRGGIAFHWENAPRHIFADYLYLDDTLRGGGFGRRLMEELIAYAETGGASRIDLTTSTFQAPGFYLKLGFEITEEKPDPKPLCPENVHYCLSRKLGRWPGGANGTPHTNIERKAKMSDLTFDLVHGPDNPRNSEGAFLRTASGRIRFVYSRYTGDNWHDGATADLAEVYSDDDGNSWQDRGVIVPRGSADNIMSVSLLRLAADDVRMFYLEKRGLARRNNHTPARADGDDGCSSCVPMMRVSADDGETWLEPRRIIPFDEYYVMNNDRAIRLASGRIVMPFSHHMFRTGGSLRAGVVFTLYSDDNGNSWKESDTVLCPNFQAETKFGFQEPGLVELAPGKLMLWIRTLLGFQFKSYSYDGGETWSAAVPDINFPSPASPMSIKRDPESGILYAVWNGTDRQLHPVLPHPLTNGRSPLVMIRSLDDGETWERKRPVLLETDPERGYCYTAMEFLSGGELLLAYCCGRHLDGGSNLQDLRIRKLNVNELWKD